VTLLQIALVLAIVGGLVIAFGIWQLQQSYRAPHATPAGVTWSAEQVALPGDGSLVSGRVTIDVTGLPTAGVLVGLSAAAPRFSGALETGTASSPGNAVIAIGGPLVRVTATAPGTPRGCVAPCELQIPADFQCNDGSCRMVVEVSLELVDTGVGTGGAVSLEIGGGVGPLPPAPPPASAMIEISFEPAASPGPGG
jgi:hypothetical protein